MRAVSLKRQAQIAAGTFVAKPRKPLKRGAKIASVGKAKKRSNSREIRFKASIRERDGHTCQVCGKEGKGLHVHHLFTVGHRKDLEFVAWNCLTLCSWCHLDGPEAAHRRMTEFRQVVAFSFPWFAERYDVQGDCVKLEDAHV